MKNLFKSMLLVAVAAMGLTACSNNEVDDVVAPGKLTKKITVVGDITRTEFNDDLTKLVWSEGDTFGAFTNAEDVNLLSSAYTADATGFGLEVNADATTVYAYYPYYSGNSSKTATEMSVGIPGTQTQSIAGQLTKGNLPMVAQGTIEGDVVALSFKPTACVLGFNIYGDAELNEKITSIKFTAAGDEKSSGYDYYYDLTDANSEFTPGYQYTTLNLSGDAQFVPAVEKAAAPQVYLVVNKISYSAGVEILITTEGGTTYTFTSTQAIDCTETYRTMNLNLSKAVKYNPEAATGPYVSDKIFTCTTDNSGNAVYTLGGESMIGEESATGFKLGTSSKEGTFTSGAVGVTGDKYLVFYGVGWYSKIGNLEISVNDTTVKTLELAINNGATGNAPYKGITVSASDFYVVKLSDLTADSKITFKTTSSGCRAILFGIKLSDEAPELPAMLTVTPNELSFDAAGGEETFTVALENSEEEIVVSEETDWLTVTDNEDGSYTVTATAYNNTETNRTATITVTAGALSNTVTVTQNKYVESVEGEVTESLDIFGKNGNLVGKSITWTGDYFTLTNNQDSSPTAIRTQDSDHYRAYAKSKLIFTAKNDKTITKIVITCTSSSYATVMKNSLGDSATVSGSVVTWVGSAAEVSYSMTAQARFNKVEVTLN